jgi:hypothetical protein
VDQRGARRHWDTRPQKPTEEQRLAAAALRQGSSALTKADGRWKFLIGLILFARNAQEEFHSKGEYLKARTSKYVRARLSEIWLGHRKGKLSGKANDGGSRDLTA